MDGRDARRTAGGTLRLSYRGSRSDFPATRNGIVPKTPGITMYTVPATGSWLGRYTAIVSPGSTIVNSVRSKRPSATKPTASPPASEGGMARRRATHRAARRVTTNVMGWRGNTHFPQMPGTGADQVELSHSRHSSNLSPTLFFDLGDLLAQPAGEGLFQFQLRATAVEIVDRLAFVRKWNEPAR
jgi:hypothetical protein